MCTWMTNTKRKTITNAITDLIALFVFVADSRICIIPVRYIYVCMYKS